MTRPDKHAARFGDRYQPPIDWRRFRDGLQKAQPAIHRITEAVRRYHETLVADDAMLSRVWFAPPLGYVSEDGLSASTHSGGDVVDITDPGAWSRSEWSRQTGVTFHGDWSGPADILDRIDADLLSYDSQHADGDQPWPYGSF